MLHVKKNAINVTGSSQNIRRNEQNKHRFRVRKKLAAQKAKEKYKERIRNS